MTREERKKWNYEQTHKEIDNIIYKKCSKCPEETAWKPMTEDYFYKWKYSTLDEYHSNCIECTLKYRKERNKLLEVKEAQHIRRLKYREENLEKEIEYNKNWRSENREHATEYTADYMKNNPEKQKLYAEKHRQHDISTEEWNKCLKVFNSLCAYCGISEKEAKERDKQRLHKEHVDSDGYNDLRNGVPSCRGCNDSKWKHDMETWFRKQSFFSEERLEKILWWCEEGYKDYIEEKLPYRITRSRINIEDGTYIYRHELWTVDEKRNFKECIIEGISKKDVEKQYQEYIK